MNDIVLWMVLPGLYALAFGVVAWWIASRG